LRCTANLGADQVLYQQGSVVAVLHPMALLEKYRASYGRDFDSHTIMFCGTIAATNNIDWAESYEIELFDPILNRSLRHGYTVRPLPVAEVLPAASELRF
jgi:hypothetical protein